MTRRSTPAFQRVDLAFPIRVKVIVPRDGLGMLLDDIMRWLRTEVPGGDCGHGPGQTLGGDALAVHFRRLEDAERFVAAFPGLELADATRSRAYLGSGGTW